MSMFLIIAMPYQRPRQKKKKKKGYGVRRMYAKDDLSSSVCNLKIRLLR